MQFYVFVNQLGQDIPSVQSVQSQLQAEPSLLYRLGAREYGSRISSVATANCPLRKPYETCETLRNEKPICESLRNLYLRKLAKTRICETLRILRNKRKTAKLVFAKPCETRIGETCETRIAKLGETLRKTNCEKCDS